MGNADDVRIGYSRRAEGIASLKKFLEEGEDPSLPPGKSSMIGAEELLLHSLAHDRKNPPVLLAEQHLQSRALKEGTQTRFGKIEVMMRVRMLGIQEGRHENSGAAGPEHARNLLYHHPGFLYMLEDMRAHDGIEARVLKRGMQDVRDDIDARKILNVHRDVFPGSLQNHGFIAAHARAEVNAVAMDLRQHREEDVPGHEEPCDVKG